MSYLCNNDTDIEHFFEMSQGKRKRLPIDDVRNFLKAIQLILLSFYEMILHTHTHHGPLTDC